jgi:hypothetical protein
VEYLPLEDVMEDKKTEDELFQEKYQREYQKNPLARLRRDVEGGVRVFRWAAVDDDGSRLPCPVRQGDHLDLGPFAIEIDTVRRKVIKGRPPEWHVTFIRHDPDRVWLLRQHKPAYRS